jgi:ankyrin repeat protein
MFLTKIKPRHTLLQAVMLKESKNDVSRKTQKKLAGKMAACIDKVQNKQDGIRELQDALNHLKRNPLPKTRANVTMSQMLERQLNGLTPSRYAHSQSSAGVWGHKPLRMATANGNERIVDGGQARPEKFNPYLSQKLSSAVSTNDLDTVKALCAAGANPNTVDPWRLTPLHVATVNGNVDIVEALRRAGADLDANDPWGLTPLHMATVNGNVDIVEALCRAGANFDAKDRWGQTPLDVATSDGNAAIVEALRRAVHKKKTNAASLIQLAHMRYQKRVEQKRHDGKNRGADWVNLKCREQSKYFRLWVNVKDKRLKILEPRISGNRRELISTMAGAQKEMISLTDRYVALKNIKNNSRSNISPRKYIDLKRFVPTYQVSEERWVGRNAGKELYSLLDKDMNFALDMKTILPALADLKSLNQIDIYYIDHKPTNWCWNGDAINIIDTDSMTNSDFWPGITWTQGYSRGSDLHSIRHLESRSARQDSLRALDQRAALLTAMEATDRSIVVLDCINYSGEFVINDAIEKWIENHVDERSISLVKQLLVENLQTYLATESKPLYLADVLRCAKTPTRRTA